MNDAPKKKVNPWPWIVGGVGGLLVIASLGGEANQGDKANPGVPPKVAEVPSAPPVKKSLDAPVKQLYDDVIDAWEACDSGSKRLGETAMQASKGAASIYDAYASATFAKQSCRLTDDNLGKVKIPSDFEGATEEAASSAITTCRNAAMAKVAAAGTAQEVYDGDMRPSKIQEFTDGVEYAQSLQFGCIGALFEVANKAGVKAEILTPKASKGA